MTSSPPVRHTNILFILTDDQGPWALGCAGNDEIRTPNLDRLAASGVRMTNFFCASPVCSPARASILTGTMPSQHGVHDWLRGGQMPPDAVPFLDDALAYTDLLARNGYTCGLSGKWHLGDCLRPQRGFTHWFAHQKGGGPYRDAPMIRDGRPITAPGYVTDVITDDAIAFLRAHRQSPFYLSVHYTAPHSPWTGHPPEIVDSYESCPFNSCPQEPAHPWAGELTHQCLGKREMLKGYFAAVTAMDENVGRLLAALDALGLRENTLVLFTSDNGFSCGHRGFWGKGNGTWPLNLYENSVKVPFIASHPGRLPSGRVLSALAGQYDLFPTLLEFVGLAAPDAPARPGVSLLPVLAGNRAEARDEIVVCDEYGPNRMIRTPEWKYVHRYPYGPHELYDLRADPDERRNLANDRATAAVAAEMRRRLSEWFARYVLPERDGIRFPVSGAGQRDRIGRTGPGEDCFYMDRPGMNPPWTTP